MFGKKDKVENKETTKKVKKDDAIKYIILGSGYRQFVYDNKTDLLNRIKKCERIAFTRIIDESKLEHGSGLRTCSSVSNDANYLYDYDWMESMKEGTVLATEAFVPFKNKEELNLSSFNNDYSYNTVKKIYKSIIKDILELNKLPKYHMLNSSKDNLETVPNVLKPCIWGLSEDEITDKDVTADCYVFCTADKVPENLFYYLDGTPCNELDPIDVSILIQGLTFDTSYINILCDFKDKCQRWLKEKDVTTSRLKETFGEDICE